MKASITCRRALKNIAIAAVYLLLWQTAARLVSQQLLLPGPAQVFSRLGALILTAGFWRTLAVSMLRVLAAFALGVGLGTALAVVTSRIGWLHALLSPALGAIRATPVTSFIILALVWMSTSAVPVFTGVIMALPIVWSAVSQGIAGCDPRLTEMAQVFRLSPGKRLRYLYLPQVFPSFAAAATTSLGLTWKAVIAAEVIGTPRLAVGSAMYAAKIYLESADLFAWTLVVVAFSMLFERLFAGWVQKIRRLLAERMAEK